MGSCFSIPNVYNCQKCNITQLESYPITKCPHCNDIIGKSKNKPSIFAMPKTPSPIRIIIL